MKKVFLMVFLILLIGGGVFLFVSFVIPQTTLSDTEQKEAVARILGRKARDITPTTAPHQATLKYFFLMLPSGATEYTFDQEQIEKSPRYLSGIRFQSEHPKYFFVIRVETAEGVRSFDDIPAVRMRRINKTEYHETSMTIDQRKAVIFEKDGEEAEKTAFMLEQGRVYSLASSGQQLAELLPVFSQIIGSFHIQE